MRTTEGAEASTSEEQVGSKQVGAEQMEHIDQESPASEQQSSDAEKGFQDIERGSSVAGQGSLVTGQELPAEEKSLAESNKVARTIGCTQSDTKPTPADQSMKLSPEKPSGESTTAKPAMTTGARNKGDALIERIMITQSDSFSDQFKSNSIEELTRFINFHEAEKQYEQLQLTMSKKKRIPLIDGLVRSVDARSLDDFLTLTRLDQYKNDILNLGAGTTIMELACSSYDKNMYFDAIESMTRTQASRLARQLHKYKRKRDKEKNEKALHVGVADDKISKDERGGDEPI